MRNLRNLKAMGLLLVFVCSVESPCLHSLTTAPPAATTRRFQIRECPYCVHQPCQINFTTHPALLSPSSQLSPSSSSSISTNGQTQIRGSRHDIGAQVSLDKEAQDIRRHWRCPRRRRDRLPQRRWYRPHQPRNSAGKARRKKRS